MRPVPIPHRSTGAVSSTVYRGREMASYTSNKLHKYSRYFISLLAMYLVLSQILPVRPHRTVPGVILITPWPRHVVSDNPAPLHVIFFSVLIMGPFKNVGFHILLCLSCSSPHSWRHLLTLRLWPVTLLSSLRLVHSTIQSSGRKRQKSPVKTNISCTVDIGTNKGVGIALWDRFHQPWLLSHHNLSWTGWLNGTDNCLALPGRRTKKTNNLPDLALCI